MSTRLATGVLIAAVLAAAAPQAAAAAGPTPAQIRGALAHAEHSRRLWATVNICKDNALGIRGQMPTLGFGASLSMEIQVQYWAGAKMRFQLHPSAKVSVALGTPAHDVHQGGATFPFGPHAGLLRGYVTFVWKRGGKVLGRTHRATSAGHHDADGGDPPGYSAPGCTLG
jgi:hypothetical protein